MQRSDTSAAAGETAEGGRLSVGETTEGGRLSPGSYAQSPAHSVADSAPTYTEYTEGTPSFTASSPSCSSDVLGNPAHPAPAHAHLAHAPLNSTRSMVSVFVSVQARA